MSDARIDDLLDELVAPFEARPEGWADVVRRVHHTRRRYVLVGVALVALVLVPAAVALRGEISDLFTGTPAPPAVSTSFEANNRIADMALRRGFGDRYPHADVARAHGVLEVQTSDGPLDLWVAPNDQGGNCWWVDFAGDPEGPDGKYGFGGCDTPDAAAIEPAMVWVAPHPDLVTLWGRVHVPADRVVVELQDGSSSTLPVVEGGFLASFPQGSLLERVTAYDGDEQVASWRAQ
jgi:hypothetical protein